MKSRSVLDCASPLALWEGQPPPGLSRYGDGADHCTRGRVRSPATEYLAKAYVTYHHDMFQTGYGTPAVPPSGIPDPEFNPYHKQVFEFLALRERYMPK